MGHELPSAPGGSTALPNLRSSSPHKRQLQRFEPMNCIFKVDTLDKHFLFIEALYLNQEAIIMQLPYIYIVVA